MSMFRVNVEAGIALVTITNIRKPSLVTEILNAIEEARVSIRLWIEEGNHKITLKLTVKSDDLNRTIGAVTNCKKRYGSKIGIASIPKLVEVSVSSEEAMDEVGILARAYVVFQEGGNARLMATSSDKSVTWVIKNNSALIANLKAEFSKSAT